MNKKLIIVSVLFSILSIYAYRKWSAYQSYDAYSDVLAIEIREATRGIEQFSKDRGRLPETMIELNELDSHGKLFLSEDRQTDGYANKFSYSKISSNVYEVTSSGEDGRFGTWDDVTISNVGGRKKFDRTKFLLKF